MKKLLLSLGALSAVVAPVAAVVACGSTDSDSTAKTLSDAKAKAVAYANKQKANDPEGSHTSQIDEVITKINASKNIDELRKVIIAVAGGTDVDEILGLDTPTSSTTSNAGLTDALAQVKALDVTTVKSAGYGDVTEKSTIAKINKATTMDQLTAIMADVDSFIHSKKVAAAEAASFSATDLAGANKLLAKFGVKLDQANFDKVSPEGIFAEGNTLLASANGILQDDSHGADDFVLLIGGSNENNAEFTDKTTHEDKIDENAFGLTNIKNKTFTKAGDTSSEYYDVAEAGSILDVMSKKWGTDFTGKLASSENEAFLVYIQGTKENGYAIQIQTVYTKGAQRIVTDANVADDFTLSNALTTTTV